MTRQRARGDRLSSHDYFREALAVLGARGSDGLTIAVLCEQLQVTKGSFYHHFGGLPLFVEKLLAYWETEHSERLIALSRAEPDAQARVDALIEIAVGLPHAPEAAIRAWARSSAEVAEVVTRVDRRRERHLADAIAAVGVDRTRAKLLTRMAMDLLVGAQVREERMDLRRLRSMFEEFTKLIDLENTTAGA